MLGLIITTITILILSGCVQTELDKGAHPRFCVLSAGFIGSVAANTCTQGWTGFKNPTLKITFDSVFNLKRKQPKNCRLDPYFSFLHP
jgi:hypothetical protein